MESYPVVVWPAGHKIAYHSQSFRNWTARALAYFKRALLPFRNDLLSCRFWMWPAVYMLWEAAALFFFCFFFFNSLTRKNFCGTLESELHKPKTVVSYYFPRSTPKRCTYFWNRKSTSFWTHLSRVEALITLQTLSIFNSADLGASRTTENVTGESWKTNEVYGPSLGPVSTKASDLGVRCKKCQGNQKSKLQSVLWQAKIQMQGRKTTRGYWMPNLEWCAVLCS